jgi:ABC-type multidrug transport system permease subunit
LIRRILALVHARNLEFLRDRAALAWNLVLPMALVLGLAWVFSGPQRALFKVAVISSSQTQTTPHPFLATEHVEFYTPGTREDALTKLSRHQTDLLLDLDAEPPGYWINGLSAKGYVLERLLRAAGGATLQRHTVEGRAIRYVDWVVPGILGMNIMFSGLFGVGYVLVRYRKSGYLKRLRATPLSAFEFLLAQVTSRLVLIVVVSCLVFAGTNMLLHFPMEGSYLSLLLLACLGASSMISLGLLVAARVDSEELAGGLLNLLSWPMMIVSGVWFSMEGTHPFIQQAAQLSPLTHLLAGARAVMLDGADLAEISGHLAVLAIMSFVFLALGATLFRWSRA